MARTFGGPVPTPTLDRLAKNGLKYNRFHTTALCSPDARRRCSPAATTTPAAPASSSRWAPGSPATPASSRRARPWCSQILRRQRLRHRLFGKWHNTPESEISPAGPFDRWPTGLGFDYFYGFNQGETHQYYPVLYRNTTPGRRSRSRRSRATTSPTDMTDEAIAWTRNVRAGRPGQALVRATSHRCRPRPAPRPEGVARQVQGPVRPRLGQAARDDPREAAGDRRHPGGHEAHAATEGDPGVGRPVGRREEGLRPADGELRRASWPTPTTRSAG